MKSKGMAGSSLGEVLVGVAIVVLFLSIIIVSEMSECRRERVIATLQDVNNNGIQDIVIKDGNGDEQVLFGQADGTFKSIEQIEQDLKDRADKQADEIKKEIDKRQKKNGQ